MNVQGAIGVGTNEVRTKDTHEACQAHQVNLSFLKSCNNFTVIGLALFALGRDVSRIQTHRAGPSQTRGIAAIADDHRDPGWDLARLDISGDGFEIRPASRKENTEVLHRRGSSSSWKAQALLVMGY